MNKKIFWILGFLVVAAISCWATASSFYLMMPAMPIIAVWGMTIVFFVLASMAFKWMVEGIFNEGEVDYPKLKLWGGLGLLIFTWIIISLPTNAHTFFYKLKIGDVVTADMKTTKEYSIQLEKRKNVDPAFEEVKTSVNKVLADFGSEIDGVPGVKLWDNTISTGKRGYDNYSIKHINEINRLLGLQGDYKIKLFDKCPVRGEITHVSQYYNDAVSAALETIKENKYVVNKEAALDASRDIRKIKAMEDSIHNLIMTKEISSAKAEQIIKQAEGVLVVAYANIKSNNQFVKFECDDDKDLYTADPLETKTTRFLNPYSVAWDYFTGKIPFSFTIWLFLSILIDISGFLFFNQAFKEEVPF